MLASEAITVCASDAIDRVKAVGQRGADRCGVGLLKAVGLGVGGVFGASVRGVVSRSSRRWSGVFCAVLQRMSMASSVDADVRTEHGGCLCTMTSHPHHRQGEAKSTGHIDHGHVFQSPDRCACMYVCIVSADSVGTKAHSTCCP